MLKNFAIGTMTALTLTFVAPTIAAAQTKDIVDTAVAAGSFKTLAKALAAADLVTTLKGAGPFTVFAPTDEAFAKLPAGTLEMLLKPENKAKLTRILTYHVVAGKVMAADVTKMKLCKDGQRRLADHRSARRRRHGRQRARGQDRHRGKQRRHPRDRHGPDAERQLGHADER